MNALLAADVLCTLASHVIAERDHDKAPQMQRSQMLLRLALFAAVDLMMMVQKTKVEEGWGLTERGTA